jgi:hypothetical protein
MFFLFVFIPKSSASSYFALLRLSEFHFNPDYLQISWPSLFKQSYLKTGFMLLKIKLGEYMHPVGGGGGEK